MPSWWVQYCQWVPWFYFQLQGVLSGSVWVASFYTLWFCPSISLLFQILINTISVYLVYSLVIMIILWVIVVGTINYIIQSHVKSPKDLLKKSPAAVLFFACARSFPILLVPYHSISGICSGDFLPFNIRNLPVIQLTIQYQLFKFVIILQPRFMI